MKKTKTVKKPGKYECVGATKALLPAQQFVAKHLYIPLSLRSKIGADKAKDTE